MKYIVIIPARGGSKRLKNKNILLLNNLPLIAHSILYANKFDFLKKKDIWVNTDDNTIENISNNYECAVYRRPDFLGTDKIKTSSVLKEQVESMLLKGINFDAVILLQPTNPFRTKDLLINCIKTFEASKRSSLATFSSLTKKIGKFENNSFYPINYKPGDRSQDLEKFIFENGLIYISKVECILNDEIISKDVYPFIFDHEFSNVDIDTKEDFIHAKKILKNINNV